MELYFLKVTNTHIFFTFQNQHIVNVNGVVAKEELEELSDWVFFLMLTLIMELRLQVSETEVEWTWVTTYGRWCSFLFIYHVSFCFVVQKCYQCNTQLAVLYSFTS